MTLIPYGRQWIDDSDIDAVVETLRGTHLTQGAAVPRFEEALKESTGARYIVVFSSGTAALHAAAVVAGLKEGDEAITTPLTFAATANAVLYAGAKPVFADVEHDTGNICPASAEKLVTPRTKAIFPVDFAGHPADAEKIAQLARKHSLIVIEDACHALGATYHGQPVGSGAYADMTIFSFHPVKHVATGEGGAVATNNEEYYRKLLRFRTHGIVKEDFVNPSHGGWYMEMQELGYNYRMTDIQAALGVSQTKRLKAFVERRRAIAARYRDAFSAFPAVTPLSERGDVRHSYHLFPVLLENAAKRKEMYDRLHEEGILAQVHYIPVYMHPYYRANGYADTICPVAEDIYNRILSLPMYPLMSDEEQETVISSVKRIAGAR